MSKLEVKRNKRKHKNAPQLSVASLDGAIEEGRKINYLRCLEEPEIENCNCLREKGEISRNSFYVCKLVYPPETKNKSHECDHANDLVPNRDVFTREKYIEFLATPKKRTAPRVMPRWIRKNIPPATVYVHKLARPRHRTLMETFKHNCSHFSFFQIETIANNVYREKFSTPQQAIHEMKEKLRDHQKHVRLQKSEIKKLKKKIEKCNEFNALASKLTKVFQEFMIKEQRVDANCTETKQLASFTLDFLSKMFKGPRSDKNDSDVIDKVLCEFSNKFASFMFDVTLKNISEPSQIHHSDNCLDRLKNLCMPLQEFYPKELPKQARGELYSHSDESDSESNLALENVGAVDFNDAVTVVRELLFLTPSIIKISPEDCMKLNENLTKIQDAINSGVVKATASKRSVKSLPIDDVDGLAELKSKKKKKNKKKKGKKKNEKCFGKRDIKPQWAIEWQEKVDEVTCSSAKKKN